MGQFCRVKHPIIPVNTPQFLHNNRCYRAASPCAMAHLRDTRRLSRESSAWSGSASSLRFLLCIIGAGQMQRRTSPIKSDRAIGGQTSRRTYLLAAGDSPLRQCKLTGVHKTPHLNPKHAYSSPSSPDAPTGKAGSTWFSTTPARRRRDKAGWVRFLTTQSPTLSIATRGSSSAAA